MDQTQLAISAQGAVADRAAKAEQSTLLKAQWRPSNLVPTDSHSHHAS